MKANPGLPIQGRGDEWGMSWSIGWNRISHKSLEELFSQDRIIQFQDNNLARNRDEPM